MFRINQHLVPLQVCSHGLNRPSRHCPALIDNDFLEKNLNDIMCPTGVIVALLVHWIGLRKGAEKNMSLAQTPVIFCNHFNGCGRQLGPRRYFPDKLLLRLCGISCAPHPNDSFARVLARPIAALTFWLRQLESISSLSINITESVNHWQLLVDKQFCCLI